jgi:hypothetical protein
MINKDIKFNILTKGALSSGSSAVKDLLREYDNINIIPEEFDDFRVPGLVSDFLITNSNHSHTPKLDSFISSQKKKLWYLKVISPRFLHRNGLQFTILNRIILALTKKNYINKIKQKRCRLISGIEYILRSFTDKLIRINHLYYLSQLSEQLKSEKDLDKRIKLSNEWIRKIASINSVGKVYALFDQPILPINDTGVWQAVFFPFKLICVYRDPRDQLADMIRRGILFAPFTSSKMTYTMDNILSIYGHDRKGMIKFLTDALRRRHSYFDELANELDNEHFLLLDFEGLVNKYEDYKTKIENFLGITCGNHIFKKKYFDPDISKANIGIYKQFLNAQEIELISDLEVWYTTKLRETGAIL